MLYVFENNRYMLVVAEELVSQLLCQFHEHNGHLGQKKCLDKIKESYFWPEMEKDIATHINKCILCKKFKSGNERIRINHSDILSCSPFERICIDVCGPLEISFSGNRYVLGIIDHFSRYCCLVPIKCQDARTIATKIWTNWIAKFGVPIIIQSDKAKAFASELIEELCKKCAIS